MNHHQDIDDGLEEYLESATREQDEATFARQPELFTGDLGQEGDGDPFLCTRIVVLHLTGGKFETRNHPLAYDGGFVELEGRLKQGGPVRVKLRWSGPTSEVTIERIG